MALVHCPECKKEISDKAHSCPHCGFPLSEFVLCVECNTFNDKINTRCNSCGFPFSIDKITQNSDNSSNEKEPIESKGPIGIGGFLAFYGLNLILGVIITCMYFIFGIIDNDEGYIVSLSDLLIRFMLAGLYCYTFYLFWEYSKRFIFVAISMHILQIFIIVIEMSVDMINHNKEFIPTSFGFILGNFIWILYLFFSRRVKYSYTE